MKRYHFGLLDVPVRFVVPGRDASLALEHLRSAYEVQQVGGIPVVQDRLGSERYPRGFASTLGIVELTEPTLNALQILREEVRPGQWSEFAFGGRYDVMDDEGHCHVAFMRGRTLIASVEVRLRGEGETLTIEKHRKDYDMDDIIDRAHDIISDWRDTLDEMEA